MHLSTPSRPLRRRPARRTRALVLAAVVLGVAVPSGVAAAGPTAVAAGPTAVAAGPVAAPADAPAVYRLSGGGLRITYTTLDPTDGSPHVTYRDNQATRRFNGREVTITPSPIGTLVTVVLSTVPDLGSTSFTLVVPAANLDPTQATPIATYGVRSFGKDSIGGPALLKGQIQDLTVTPLRGTARLVSAGG